MLEFRGLQDVILQAARPSETPSDIESLKMDLLKLTATATATTRYTHNSASQAPSQPRLMSEPPRIPANQQGEEIESYLRRFERLAKT